MAVEVGSAIGYLDLDTSRYMNNLQEAKRANETFNKQSDTTSKKLSGLGGTLAKTGTALTKGITVPVVAAGAASVTCATNFESSMSKVESVSGVASDSVIKLANGSMTTLGEKAKEMGAITKFSASEAADAMYYMGLAGWDAQSMVEGLDGVMNLAAASGEDLATTSDIVTDALTAFGLQASDSSHFADILAKASSSSNTTVGLMGETFKYVAPLCGAMGYSAEDCAVAVGLMANAGIKGSMAGTSLKTALSNLAKPTDEQAALMKELGISITNSDGTMKSLDEVMQNVRGSMKGLSKDQQAAAASTLFGKEAMSGMLAVVNASETDYNNLHDAIYNCDGTAKDMSDTMLNNLSGQLTIIKSSLEGLAISLGDILLPLVKKFAEFLQGVLDKLNRLSEEQKRTILVIAGLVAVLGPVLMIFGKLITIGAGLHSKFTILKGGFEALKLSIAHVSEAFSLARAGLTGFASQTSVLGTALGSLTAPILAVIAIIAVLVAAFKHLWETNEEFREKMQLIWSSIKTTVDNFCQGIVDRINALGFDFENITQVLKAIWDGFCNLLAPIFSGVFQEISVILSSVCSVLTGILDFFIGLFTLNWEQCWSGVKEIFGGIWNAITGTLSVIFNILKGITNVFLGWFGTSWEEVWGSISSFFINIWTGISTFFSSLWDGIKSVVTSATNAIKSITSTAWGAIKSYIINPIQEAYEKVKSVFDGIKSKISSVMDSAKSIVSGAMDKIKSVFSIDLKFPKIKLPHFSIGGKFSLDPPSVPHFDVDWYETGGVFNKPSIIGVGENGSEAVVPLEKNLGWIKNLVKQLIEGLKGYFGVGVSLGELFKELNNTMLQMSKLLDSLNLNFGNTLNEVRYGTNRSDTGKDTPVVNKDRSISGNNFNFYSNQKLSEIESAKQMKKAIKQLEEEFA